MDFERELLECMRIMDSVEEVGDCWIWQGYSNGDGYPQYKSTIDSTSRLVRRMVWRFHGREIGRRIPLGCKCGERTCINPEHMFETTTAAIGRKVAKRGGWTGLARAAKIAAKRRISPIAKLDIDKVAAIRESTTSSTALALEYGVSRSVIKGIRNGTRWKDYTNPFRQLMLA